jgi:hypothetical protein
MLGRQHEVVHAYGVGAVPQECLTGTAFISGIGHPDPEQDFTGFNCVFELSRVAVNKP